MNNTQKQIVITLVFFIVLGIAACVIYFAGILPSSTDASGISGVSNMVIGSVDAPAVTTVSEPEEISSVSEPEPEPAAETEPVAETKPVVETKQYYSFVTTNRYQILHVRETPDMNGKILARLDPGTRGYVLEHAPEWSLIVTGDNIKGYSYNQYLDLTEITPEELPEQYRPN